MSTGFTRERFSDRTVVVVGGGRGIGAATARAFANENARVVVADALGEAAAAIARTIREEGGEATAVTVDVAQPSQVEDLIGRTVAEYGGLDVLFNNVGIARYGRVEDLEIGDWDLVMDTNLRAMFLACKYAIPVMRAGGGGAIVNTSSSLAHASQETNSAYCASKAGVLALTRTIAIDHAEDNIRCNSISPGTIDTPIVRIAASRLRPGNEADFLAERGLLHPLGRMGRPEEVASVVLFLASEAAGFITGSDYAIDGGIRAKLIKT